MKIFAFFMAIYILVLSAVPCSDVHIDCNDNSNKIELTQNHDHHFAPFQIKNPTVFHISEKVTIRNFSFISNFFGSIWQPPKIMSNC